MSQHFKIDSISERPSLDKRGALTNNVEIRFHTAGGVAGSIMLPKDEIDKRAPDDVKKYVGDLVAEAAKKLDGILNL